jgi:hypothetical protein
VPQTLGHASGTQDPLISVARARTARDRLAAPRLSLGVSRVAGRPHGVRRGGSGPRRLARPACPGRVISAGSSSSRIRLAPSWPIPWPMEPATEGMCCPGGLRGHLLASTERASATSPAERPREHRPDGAPRAQKSAIGLSGEPVTFIEVVDDLVLARCSSWHGASPVRSWRLTRATQRPVEEPEPDDDPRRGPRPGRL